MLPVVAALLAGRAGCGGQQESAAPLPSATTPVVTPTATATPPAPSRSSAAPHPSRSTAQPVVSPTRSTTNPRPTTPTPRPTTPTVTPTPVGGNDNRVYVVGDSVLLGTTTTLPAALRGWRVTMDCVGSRRLTQAIPLLQSVRSRLGAVVVIQMGNNYIAGEDGTFAAQIDRAMNVLAGVRRVVWVTVAEKWPSRVAINRAIRAAASRWPSIRVADWAPLVAAHPTYAYDMLHLTPSGRLAMSRLIAGVVGAAPSATA